MSSSLPWSPTAPNPMANDATAVLGRIERNTASILQWMKMLAALVVVLILVTVIVFV